VSANDPVPVNDAPVYVKIIELVDKNKAKAAFLAPLIVAVGSAVGSWIVTGDFNDAEIRTAAGGAVLAVVSGVSTWLTKSKEAIAKVQV
jgi:hypothetical protein